MCQSGGGADVMPRSHVPLPVDRSRNRELDVANFINIVGQGFGFYSSAIVISACPKVMHARL